MGFVSFDVAVVGGGVAGLSAAFEIRRRRPDWSIKVLEREEVAGGKVRSSSSGGFTFDWGPNGFQPSQATFDLISLLGLEEELIEASPRARKRYLYRAGGLRPVPLKPQEFLSSELLSPAGKVRALLEPFLAGTPPSGEETVFAFAARHFGPEAARSLASPMVLGVAAGDARQLSVDALFPRIRQLEREHGSLLKGMAKMQRASRGAGRPASAALYSFAPGSMGTLTAELARQLGESVVAGAEVESLKWAADSGFELTLAGGERLAAARVVLSTPAFVSADLLHPLLPAAAAPLRQIPYADVTVFALAFGRVDVPHALDGFGFLVPRGEGVRSLGVIWTSALFEGSAPPGTVLLRVIAGGSVDPAFASLDEAEALAAVRRDLRLTMGITAEPLMSETVRIPRAIPQYLPGHLSRIGEALAAVRSMPGLALAGNALSGVAVNDCIRDAQRVADEVTGS
ncbi:MAG TPA: protoporphyrinogen oxidase [Trueperaceae bacterium]